MNKSFEAAWRLAQLLQRDEGNMRNANPDQNKAPAMNGQDRYYAPKTTPGTIDDRVISNDPWPEGWTYEKLVRQLSGPSEAY